MGVLFHSKAAHLTAERGGRKTFQDTFSFHETFSMWLFSMWTFSMRPFPRARRNASPGAVQAANATR
jgi:hypothetical protein